MLNLVTAIPFVRPEDVRLSIDELAREGARRMLMEALQAEVADYIDKHKDLRDEAGQRLVVRHGKAQTRSLTVGAGTIGLQAPRVKDRRSDERFTSQILPAYMRKSPKVENLLPILYLKGLSTSDFKSALTEFFGEGTLGLSASSIVALKRSWEADFKAWKKKSITDRYVYLFADGVHVSVRLGEDKKLCLLVLIGVAENGEKHLLAVERGIGFLGGSARDRRIREHAGAALLASQDGQYPERPPQTSATSSQGAAPGNHVRRDTLGGESGEAKVSGRGPPEIPEGRLQAREGLDGTYGLLHPASGSLDPSADDEPD